MCSHAISGDNSSANLPGCVGYSYNSWSHCHCSTYLTEYRRKDGGGGGGGEGCRTQKQKSADRFDNGPVPEARADEINDNSFLLKEADGIIMAYALISHYQ